jgi:ketosteroid isomerase-like protein
MATLEQRIQAIEDRQALQDLAATYFVAIDDLANADDILACFTQDAVFDMSAIGYPAFAGIDALREFFTGVVNGLEHSAHYGSNFKIDSLEQDRASVRIHAVGMGLPHGGERSKVYVQYHLTYQRIDGQWKISAIRGTPLMTGD